MKIQDDYGYIHWIFKGFGISYRPTWSNQFSTLWADNKFSVYIGKLELWVGKE
jgi:hypothetical protein